jgi:hypothetical protein
MSKKMGSSSTEATKPKYTKSRNGCVTCKKRRLKCDETKPYCQNCVKRGIVCGGYAVNFKWRDFSETNTNTSATNTTTRQISSNFQGASTNSFMSSTIFASSMPQTTTTVKSNKRKASFSKPQLTSDAFITSISGSHKGKDKILEKAMEEATLSVTGKSTKEVAIANLLISQGKNPDLALAVASTLTDMENNESVQKLLKDKNFNESVLLNLGENMRGKTTPTKQTDADIKEGIIAVKEEREESEDENEDQDENVPLELDEVRIENINVSENQEPRTISTSKLTENDNRSLLHSLADIASRTSPSTSTTYPFSPFNDPFSLDSFSNKQKLPSVRSSKFTSSTLPILPPLNAEIISATQLSKESPLNLFKESPQAFMNSMKSPTSFLQSYQLSGNNMDFSQRNVSLPSTSNHPTPKFDDIESGFQPYSKFSPLPRDMNSPGINSISSILNNHDSTLQLSSHQQMNSINNARAGQSPIEEVNTPRTVANINNQLSPFSAMLQFPLTSTSHQENSRSNRDEAVESLDIGSPNSVTSLVSSTLGNSRQPNEFMLPLQQQHPVDLFAMHIPDEHLAMLLAFDQHTCGIMSIKNGPTENPWRSFLLPMSVDHPVVRSALLAMTCFHIARGDAAVRERGVKYMKHAIVSLVHGLSSSSSGNSQSQNKLIKDGNHSDFGIMNVNNSSSSTIKKIPPDVALATCIALAMGEAWDRHISTGIAHLKGAKSMIIRVLNKLQGGKKRKRSKRSRSGSSSSIDSFGSVVSELASDEGSIGKTSRLNTIEERDEEIDLKEKKLPRELQFLVNAWMYFDVLARMTSNCTDEPTEDDEEEISDGEGEDADVVLTLEQDDQTASSVQSTNSFYGFSKNISPENTGEIGSVPLKRRSSSFPPLSSSSSKRMRMHKSKQKRKSKKHETDSASVIAKFRSFNLEEGDAIDPLLGVAQTLFPIMGRVATLISQVRQYKMNHMTISSSGMATTVKTPLRMISKAVELKSEIECWKLPNLPANSKSSSAEDPSFDLNAAVATAEAYRYATLLYLHQTVPEVPSLTSHSLAENVMMLLASVPGSSRTLVTHMFPLFVASCEARPGEEREWAKERWLELIEKMWIGTLERSWEVIKEVWARKDAFYAKKHGSEHNAEDGNAIIDEEDGDINTNTEYKKVKRRISRVIHGNDEDMINDEDNHVGNWTHWTSVMKDWGWEVLLA